MMPHVFEIRDIRRNTPDTIGKVRFMATVEEAGKLVECLNFAIWPAWLDATVREVDEQDDSSAGVPGMRSAD